MYGVTLNSPGAPSLDRLLRILEVGVEQHTDRVLAQWKRGREPACCAKCAGLLYRPKRLSSSQTYYVGELAQRRGEVSCEEAAIMTAGYKRAQMIRNGVGRKAAATGVRLEGIPTGDRVWHVFVRTPQGKLDPTKGMRRAG